MDNTSALIFGDAALAKLLNVHVSTPPNWRKAGTGPRFIRCGLRRIAYRVSDIEAWLDARTNMPAAPGPDAATPVVRATPAATELRA